MKTIYAAAFVALMLCVVSSCRKLTDNLNPSNPDWTAATHGKDTAPNYDVVFPQNQVNTLEITLGAEQWKAIQADMLTRSGMAFGSGRMTVPGGIPGGNPLDLIPGDPIYVASTVKFNGKAWEKVGFRLKGNSSLSSTWRTGSYKLPFRLHFDRLEDQHPDIKNQRFYGFRE
ncbi:MAG: spore coat protein CotH, partial [Runella sp.]